MNGNRTRQRLSTRLYTLVLSFLALCFLSRCEPLDPKQVLETDKFYKRDMIVSVNGVIGEGVLVAPFSNVYQFEVEARGTLDLFVMSTCHREVVKERAYNVEKIVKSGPFGWGERKIIYTKKVRFEYRPTEEERGYCPVLLAGFDKDHGKNSWAFVDFEGGPERSVGQVRCNGEEYAGRGASVCQSRQGLIQSIQFEEGPVIVESEPGCDHGEIEGMTWRYKMSKGQCVYAIMSGKELHRHTAIGYEGILIRE